MNPNDSAHEEHNPGNATCDYCKGNGNIPRCESESCPVCCGRGEVCVACGGLGGFAYEGEYGISQTCESCSGLGIASGGQ